MTEVIILRPGFVQQEHVGTEVMVRAGCTISLIRAQENILVDSGGPSESALLVALLAAQSLHPQQIQYVIYTHGHIDHVGNSNLFPQATFIAGRDRAIGDRYAQLDYSTGPLRLADDVYIIPTPGHTSEDISVLVTTATGLVAIVGDVFEHAGDNHHESWTVSSWNQEVQRASRERILSIADRIVPGHGGMFSVNRGNAT
jgi:glyoxylase-like metal-dependent hydrolase (beta-lactamase superfamily II)